jgi:hypothetical protein
MKFRHAWRVTAAVVFMILLIVASLLSNIFYTNHVVHELCGIINITANAPVPKGANPANPSRQYSAQIHQDFVNLQTEYDC